MFRIEDTTWQAVAYTYFRRDENEARQTNVLTNDEARRIAALATFAGGFHMVDYLLVVVY